MPPQTAFLPRIYSLPASFTPGASDHARWLAHAAALGFDHVLVGNSAVPELAALRKACEQNKLRLLLDFDLTRMLSDPALANAQPDWFERREEEDALPDPRRPPAQTQSGALRLRNTAQVLDALIAHLHERLRHWRDAGVSGFRCLGLTQLAPERWRALLSGQEGARFLAWTPGCTPEQIAALSGVGFDLAFSSAAWWDYRSRWLAEEHLRLAALAPPIGFPDSPDESVLARIPGYDDPASRERICRRALRLAAGLGNGWMMPLGFEFGLSDSETQQQEAARSQAVFDLSEEVRQCNALAARAAHFQGGGLRQLGSGEGGATVLLRTPGAGQVDEGLLFVINPDATIAHSASERQLLEHAEGLVRAERVLPSESGEEGGPSGELKLEPADLQIYIARRRPPVVVPSPRSKAALATAMRAPRIAIEAITPAVDNGRFVVKRSVGDVVDVEADVFMDGHDKLAVALLWRATDEGDWQEVRMHALGNDRWRASLPLTRLGRHQFAIEAWRDAFATYRDELEKKSSAALNVALELEEGRLLVEATAAYAEEQGLAQAQTLKALAKTLKVAGRDKSKATERDAERIAALLSEPTAAAMRAADARPFAVRSETLRIDAERRAARFSSWYELFPRSQSGDPQRHGTFDDVIARLPAIQAMGFDTLYFPPIHPIGKAHRKGRNNSLTPAPEDPGSPYAIGSEEGGHDAIHPQLGTIEDFRRLRDEAERHGLELALDFAIQCSPDHPWLKQHPEWFDWRPDGSIRYAENPPKKYQDIVNVDFYAEGAIPSLWCALRDVILYWVKEGVRTFRVDNPHTKSLAFWEWMIADVKSRHPDTIFLSEAFTRPKMMYRLAKVGFSQSYTYFTWRHNKQEFTDYLTELTQTPVREFFRPHFFVNTPDINPPFLQKSGRPGFLIRTALATTLSGLWGMYSGFELCEGTPVPGKEEYLDSEKYEIRAWDWNRPGNIIEEITQLNRIRKENRALQSHRGVRFLPCSSEHMLVFLKTSPPAMPEQALGDNVLLVAIVLDPFHAHEGSFELPLWQLGLPDDGAVEAVDLLSGARISWHGKNQQLRLDPFANPYGIWRLRQGG